MENNPTCLWVVAAALRAADGRWLMQQRPASKPHGGLWEFPGGKVEAHEMPHDALVRELHEELAITLEPSDLIPLTFATATPGIADRAASGRPVILLYTLNRWRGLPNSQEGGTARWFAREALSGLPMPPLDRVLLSALPG
ncbi:MAG: (deoxy)nucleoside triphosphate pyrophosphohydrolase [Parerythrobacter sp.]